MVFAKGDIHHPVKTVLNRPVMLGRLQKPGSVSGETWYISEFSGDFAKVWVACQASPVWVPSNAVAR